MSRMPTRLVVFCVIVLFGSMARLPSSEWVAASVRPSAGVSFQDRVSEYTRLRRQIAERLQASGLAGGDGTDADFRRTLARAIQDARRDARVGDVFGLDVANRIQQVVRTDLSARTSSDRQEILLEVPVVPRVRVNDVYPEGEPLATTPPLLLMQLAPLPPELQYRFLEDAVILLDVDTSLIVDLVPNVLGRRST